MTLKKIKIINVFGVFLLSVLCHFAYNWLPNSVFSVFFPVNESIWEHMKIFFTATLLYGFVDKFLLKRYEIQHNNFLFQLVFNAFFSIPVYLILFLPLYNLFGENMYISIGLMILVYTLCAYMSYKFLTYRELEINKYILYLIIIIVYGIFTYLTYKPIHNYIFYDKQKEKYGINDYTS